MGYNQYTDTELRIATLIRIYREMEEERTEIKRERNKSTIVLDNPQNSV